MSDESRAARMMRGVLLEQETIKQEALLYRKLRDEAKRQEREGKSEIMLNINAVPDPAAGSVVEMLKDLYDVSEARLLSDQSYAVVLRTIPATPDKRGA